MFLTLIHTQTKAEAYVSKWKEGNEISDHSLENFQGVTYWEIVGFDKIYDKFLKD